MKKKWTREEIRYLTENWNAGMFKEIMESLGRTEDSIMRKARRLGLAMHKKEDDLKKRRWTGEEDKFIINYYKKMPSEEIASYTGRTASAVRKRAQALKLSAEVSRWSREEEQILFEKWGMVNIDTIARKLNRSRNAVLLKACHMSLREQVTANGTYLTPADIGNILDIKIRTLYTWMRNGLIKYRKFKVGKKMKYQITVDAFCKFLKEHKNKWDSKEADIGLIKSYFSSYFINEDGTLLFREKSIAWLEEKITKDKQEYRKLMKPWTTREEKELVNMLEAGCTHKEICCKLGRSVGSTKTKIYTLKNRTSYQVAGMA